MGRGLSGGRVQQGNSSGEKAVPKPAGLGPEAPEAPPRGQEDKQIVCRMRGVFEDVVHPLQTPYPLDVLDGREWDTDDVLGV